MAVLIVDSSAWIAYFDGLPSPLLEMGLQSQSIMMPPMVLTEILGNQLHQREREMLIRLFDKTNIIECGAEHFMRAGKLKSELESRGVLLTARDAHLIQCAIDHKGALLTKDPYFLEIQRYLHVEVYL